MEKKIILKHKWHHFLRMTLLLPSEKEISDSEVEHCQSLSLIQEAAVADVRYAGADAVSRSTGDMVVSGACAVVSVCQAQVKLQR